MSAPSYLTTGEQQFKTTVESLGLQFMSADINEANLNLDSFKETEQGIVIWINPTKERNSQTSPNTVKRRLSVMGFILYRTVQSTIEKPTMSLKDTVQQARYNLDMLVKNLNSAAITEDNGIEDWSSTETFSEFDAGLHGIMFQFEWPISDLLSCGS